MSTPTPGHRSDEAFVGLRRLGGHRGAYYHHVARCLKNHRGHRLQVGVAALPYLRLHIIARNARVVEVLVEEPEAIVEQFYQPVVMIEVPMSQPPRIPQQNLGGKAIDSFPRSSAPIILKHAMRQFRAPDEGPLRRQGGATKGFTCMPLCVPLHRIGPTYAPFAASMRIRTATATINRAKPRRRNISGMRSLRPTPSQAPNTAPKIRVGRLPSWIRPVPR
jgi:hypothetical protein